MNTNDNCDGAGPHVEGEVRLIRHDRGEEERVCRACHGRRIRWRSRQNNSSKAQVFTIHSWDELEVYPKPDAAQEQARMRRRNARTIGL